MKKFNYYESQLEKLKESEYPMSIKLYDGKGNQTNQIDINIKSIPVLLKFLQNKAKVLKKKAE